MTAEGDQRGRFFQLSVFLLSEDSGRMASGGVGSAYGTLEVVMPRRCSARESRGRKGLLLIRPSPPPPNSDFCLEQESRAAVQEEALNYE